MLTALPALVMAPLLVGGSTLVSHRWGARLGGLVSALPAVVGPGLLISAELKGAAFAARAANGTLVGLSGLSAFAVVYGRAALRSRPGVSLAAGWVAAGALSAAAGAITGGLAFPAGLVVAVVSLVGGYRALPATIAAAAAADEAAPGAVAGGHLPHPGREAVLRMLVTVGLVVLLTLASLAFGPLAGGILAALPVLASVMAVFTHRRDGPRTAVALLRGMLRGLLGFVAFCGVVALLIVPAGMGVAFAVAAVAAVAVQAAALIADAATGAV